MPSPDHEPLDDDLGETVDSAQESPDASKGTAPNSPDDENVLGATLISSSENSDNEVAATLISDWEATLDADVEPGHTIKAPVSVTSKRKGSLEETVALKRRSL
jgi:hypothetical protein